MAKKRALLIDAQLFQSMALHRGVGKYSLSLLKQLNKEAGLYNKKILIFNDSGIDKQDLNRIKEIASNFELEFLPLRRAWPSNFKYYKNIEKTNKEILDRYVRDNFSDYVVDFLVLSLFQHVECPTFPGLNVRKYLLVYDLIPLLFSELYLRDPGAAKTYLSRYKVLYQADHFFTISRKVANDLSINLGIPKDHITPIYGAPINRKLFRPEALQGLVNEEFILLPSGDDPRKNNQRAVMAFEEFNRKHGGRFRLVITSYFGEGTRNKLRSLCGGISFTGNVSDSQLAWLYKNASLVLFPSISEGLGMPVIEAVEFGKPVVCSDLDVFKEISETAFKFCDPSRIESIEKAITQTFKNGLKVDTRAYKEILDTNSWGRTTKLFLKRLKKPPIPQLPKAKPKIAIFAPSPSGYSAIGKFVQEQHYVFSKLADIDYYLEAGISDRAKRAKIRENLLPFIANCKDPWLFDDDVKNRYDRVIYHIGNSEYHVATLVKALSFPATVAIHDPNIEGLYNVLLKEGILTNQRLEAEQRLHDLIKPKEAKFITSLLSKQEEIIVHSAHAKDAVEESLPRTINQRPSLVRLNLTTPIPYQIETRGKKDTLTVVIAGLVHEAKGPEIIEEIAKIKLPDKLLALKIIGFSLLSPATEERITKVNNVEIVYSPSDARFLQELLNSDIIFNYRSHYQGEPSLAALEAMRQGKAVIVNKQGWFDKLPDELVYKARTKAEAISLILKISNIDQAALADKRLDYVEKHHNISNYISTLVRKGDIEHTT